MILDRFYERCCERQYGEHLGSSLLMPFLSCLSVSRAAGLKNELCDYQAEYDYFSSLVGNHVNFRLPREKAAMLSLRYRGCTS
jgi:hypothetical protein